MPEAIAGAPAPPAIALTVSRYKAGRFWAVREAGGTLVCVCVYRRGAREVARRLTGATASAGDNQEAPAGRLRPRRAGDRKDGSHAADRS
jgi:hypothetical protein